MLLLLYHPAAGPNVSIGGAAALRVDRLQTVQSDLDKGTHLQRLGVVTRPPTPPQPPPHHRQPTGDEERDATSTPHTHTPAAATQLQPPPPPHQAPAAAPLQKEPETSPPSPHHPTATSHRAGEEDGALPVCEGADHQLRPHPHPLVQHVADGAQAEGRRSRQSSAERRCTSYPRPTRPRRAAGSVYCTTRSVAAAPSAVLNATTIASETHTALATSW